MPKEKDGSAPYIDIPKERKGEQDTFGHPWNPVTPRVHNSKIFALSTNIYRRHDALISSRLDL